MAPAASILFPTRRRRDYLAVALASVSGQADAHGAEIVVVEDDPADAATEQLAAAHGARYVALGAPRGLNVARNAAVEAAEGELLCFLDDDVAAWPDWLGALLAAAGAHPGHEAFGGPIRARLEGTNLHACGREPAPVTTLDLGAEDRDAELVWGANLAVRRGALARVGGFDPARSGPGDEEEWERRLRAAGGRILYVAGAGVDHRRAGADARIRGLARAGWHRGRHARRFDEAKGTAPSLAGELRTLTGCVWHTGRYRCGNGIVLTAQTAGRLREAVAERDAPPAMPDAAERPAPSYLSGQSGTLGRRALLVGGVRDRVADALTLPRTRAVRRAARTAPPVRRVHVAGVARPELAPVSRAIAEELSRSRHDVALHVAAGAPGLGKWANLRAGLAAHPADGADWLLIVDDDVVLPAGFLDAFLLSAERFGLRARPARARVRVARRLAGHAPAPGAARPGARASSSSGR